MTRMVALNALKAGISRLRTKGSPDSQTLFDLLNGYVTQAGTVESRPGTRAEVAPPEGTVGLMAYKERLYVFSDTFVSIDQDEDKYRCLVLTHPEAEAPDPDADPDDPPVPRLVRVHFAEPYLSYPYVVGEWSDGSVYHYWLEGESDTAVVWQPDTFYRLHQLIQPSETNGIAYRATRLGAAGPVWQPNVERTVGDVVEPTVFNGFEYEVVEAYGNPPRSAGTEPAWVTEPDGIVIEEADLSGTAPTQTTPGAGTMPDDVRDRYGTGVDGALTSGGSMLR